MIRTIKRSRVEKVREEFSNPINKKQYRLGTSIRPANTGFGWVTLLLLLAVVSTRLSFLSYLKRQHVALSQEKCPANCTLSSNPQLWTTSMMLQRAIEERNKLIANLKVKYGEEYFSSLFIDPMGQSIGKSGFKSANETKDASRQRFVRKVMKKLLSVQLAAQEKDCVCDMDDGQSINKRDAFNLYESFVWANGGHSVAAGHGNLHNESYTAVMEIAAKDAFASVGIKLEGRNYAMGSVSSSPELALCLESIFGLDADLITWNFGLIDGAKFQRHLLYSHRRGVHRNRPLLLDMDIRADIGGEHPLTSSNARLDTLRQVEASGLPAMYMAVNHMHDYGGGKSSFPDMQTMTQEEIDAVPENLRYFRCGDRLEKGDPFCGDHKYTQKCATGQALWHPGWKSHALEGNILAMFMVDLLVDTLTKLEAIESTFLTKKSLLDQLQSSEDEDYEVFFNSSFPGKSDVATDTFPQDLLFQSPSLCHTALFPSETRYKGIVTDERINSSVAVARHTKEFTASRRTDSREAPLAFAEIPNKEVCSSPDQKDFFYVLEHMGNASIVVPNKAQKDEYWKSGRAFHGLVVMCFYKCGDWSKCPNYNLGEDAIDKGKANMYVNDHGVKNLVKMDDNCHLLQGSQGFFWEPNNHDQFEFTVQILDPNGSMRITSVILM